MAGPRGAPDKLVELTAAQLDALRWLVERERAGQTRFRGSNFEDYYGERWRAEYERETGRKAWSPELGRCRAWWRTGGAMLRRLAEKGCMREDIGAMIRGESYAPIYELTDTGRGLVAMDNPAR